MAYEFKDEYINRIYMRASPSGKNHMTAFAWREKPKTLENHWVKHTKGWTDEKKAELTKTIFLSADAQELDRRQRLNNRDRLVRPPGIAPWFAGGCWDNGIENSAERTAKAEINCKCGNLAVLGRRFGDICLKCYDEFVRNHDKKSTGIKIDTTADMLRQTYVKMGVAGMTIAQQKIMVRKYLEGLS